MAKQFTKELVAFKATLQMVRASASFIDQQLALASALMPLRVPQREERIAVIATAREQARALRAKAEVILFHMEPNER